MDPALGLSGGLVVGVLAGVLVVGVLAGVLVDGVVAGLLVFPAMSSKTSFGVFNALVCDRCFAVDLLPLHCCCVEEVMFAIGGCFLAGGAS